MLTALKVWWDCFWNNHELKPTFWSQGDGVTYQCTKCGRRWHYDDQDY